MTVTMTDRVVAKSIPNKAVGAMLGAAYGDALGWPNERPGNSQILEQPLGQLHEFTRWSRRSGGRFYAHEEVIEPGEYSDDTQLILCLGRSLLKGDQWWEFYTRVELPFWSLYERGGGGATKRAVNSWLDGIEPWNPKRKPNDVQKYFSAGGNGVAMRALPHALKFSEKNFFDVARSILLDGIATHGHPRALLGAIVYGFALRTALRKKSTLGYGELIEELIEYQEIWSIPPSHYRIFPEWLNQAKKQENDYFHSWLSAKDEILKYLDICRSEIARGELSSDVNALEKLQCFDRNISGAGTVAAIASVYLASRYAADPLNGVKIAAFAKGSDTDTIASMSGGLLGCINGSEWLPSTNYSIQDSTYLEKIALSLDSNQSDNFSEFKALKRSALNSWKNRIFSDPVSRQVKLPDSRVAKINRTRNPMSYSERFKVEFRRFDTIDGQKIYISKISKRILTNKQSAVNNPMKQADLFEAQRPQKPESRHLGPKLPVESLDNSIRFYLELGLTIKRRSKDLVVFDGGLVLTPASYTKEFQIDKSRSIIYMEVTNIQNGYDRIAERGTRIATGLKCWKQTNRRFFRCFDPDENLVEVFETR